MKYHIGYIGGEDKNGYSCYIHKLGCQDIKKQVVDSSYTIEGTLQEAINSYLDDEMKEMGYDESIVKVFNCCE